MFKRLKREDHDEIAFRVLLAFLLMFAGLRAYLWFEYSNHVPSLSIFIREIHVHHFAVGITVLAIAGYIALVAPYFRRKIAWLYGAGLALAFDEFSMWLKLNDDYWTRTSITAVVLIGGFFVNIIYFKNFWARAWRTTRFVNPLYPVVKHIYARVERAREHALARFSEHFNISRR
ncbi:hypothetical protein A3B21_01725 [Candidatus Uhrbacteria bacterium RIFCSPLOWO2_01_FULL_47_24]|uniref:Uncharacterized protein n=1 Tax=Candidatus Uhrbacteria bacterium RIFCSPLOWO2_01_FULL_47_24 TaxID=1802401 RepID=A0A1F7UP47_9BACT|nr:MAG: hypothetical protein A2753_04260 [Candidatus Uhrbacteria bacterium RIFCSPHIGHO2_01_FULL_47_11]OGL67887.1 MAG: hypothetical protein A3D58_04920 [Candidatus Uhrbacteria bacterium RIFCSPHIGHO2_02_FULL_46_47]OGL75340.1 MAG: hypothetical protein A3F52_03120 [Candidatus Uhrbacteria bacterium RIFCSPHIGHO2_12_FULL_47_11]OGL80073.1 MAG: hypothetical protein A3B21_01725 [Candidatus Uhrbacteria bacterium RIFCSPLOWO2_01_FULL_47_24]OGL84859.1 MAG: hypothetical protein A3J03_04110 [Candidatus Uhrbact